MASNRGAAWQRMGGRPYRSHVNTPVAKRNARMVESFKQRRMAEFNRLMELRARRALIAELARQQAAAAANEELGADTTATSALNEGNNSAGVKAPPLTPAATHEAIEV
jgi:hypothetical protein